MTDILPAWPLLTAFLLASLVLAVTPGPGVLYIVARSISQGRGPGIASMAGVALGNLVNAIGAAVGLSALFAVSSTAFAIVKYAGAAYLVYLGVKALRSASPRSAVPEAACEARVVPVFRDGFLVALFNPKTALFFAAFLPQFMNPSADPVWQSVTLGTLFVLVAATTDTVYVIGAARLKRVLSGSSGMRRFGQYAVGGTYIGLAVVAAVGEPKSR